MKRKTGFTLVEMLVTIAIIAILVTIMLPAISRARMQAEKVKCLSNLRQLGIALVNYSSDNKQWFPHAAANEMYEDWIYWQNGRNHDEGRIVKYLGQRTFDPKIFTCPSDPGIPRGGGTYAYNYTLNYYIGGWYYRGGVGQPLQYNVMPRKLTQIRNPSAKIMMVDESWNTIDDACWAPDHYLYDGHNLISNRHDKSAERSTDPNYGKGTVVFADGHADYIERVLNIDPRNWFPDDP